MKILVTSGGTKVPIDRVRHIGNMSSGTFGSKIAAEFLKLGHEVIFLQAKDSKSPFTFICTPKKDWSVVNQHIRDKFEEFTEFCNKYHYHFQDVEYSTFDDYNNSLHGLIDMQKPDVVVLAAAVSDYGVEAFTDGKIRSSDAMTIKLTPLPKVISTIRKKHPFLKMVGFKLLVDSTEEELIAAAQKSIQTNGCNMVVANDLRDIKQSNHRIILVFPSGDKVVYSPRDGDSDYLARMVAEHASAI